MKKKTVEASAIKLPGPETEPILPSLNGKVVLFVTVETAVDFLKLEGAGVGSARIGYPAFFSNPGRKADLLIFADIQLLWDDENMERFRRSVETFRKANPLSAIVVDAVSSPLFKGVTRLYEEGKINSILDSETSRGKAVEVGLEALSLLRG